LKSRTHCDELLAVNDEMETGLRAPLENISQKDLNHIFAQHKMTIGQIAVHTMSWPRYFLSETPPWEKTKWTCRPCNYPLTLAFVNKVIDDGCAAMRDKLNTIHDGLLEIDEQGKRGPGYILCRLQLHTLVHANQMSYLRSLLDPEWTFKGHFGNMATAYIKMSYHTERDKKIGGF